MTLHLRTIAHSEVGLVRKNNQDSGYTSPRLLAVADGMGGAAAGDLASAVAIAEVAKLEASPTVAGEQMLEVLAGVCSRANDTIADLVTLDSHLEGMGTTLTAGLFDGRDLALAHIGDSRGYLLRGGTLRRLTHDHSWVQSLVDEGRITEEEAHYHPHRSLILKVLNGQPVNEPDLSTIELRDGDRLLLCSDGLCGLVADEVIHDALAIDDLEASLDRLVAEAHTEGGVDNITIVIAQVGDREVPAATPQVIGAAADRDLSDIEALTATVSLRLNGGDDAAPPRVPGRDAEADRYALRELPSRRRRAAAGLGILALVLVLLAGLLGAGFVWSRSQYYVGATAEQQVAIFRGLNENFAGVSLGEVYEVQQIELSDLPPFYQEQVLATIAAANLQSARTTAEALRVAADQCVAQRLDRARSTASPAPTPSGSASDPTSGPEAGC